MNYNEAIQFMAQKERLGIKPGLSRMVKLLDIMDNPQNKIKIIHIAGTNGKGTVANSIALSLVASGFKVGIFTSPWVCDYREQIQINGKYIPKNDLARYITEYQKEDATEFELITAIMYKYFCDNSVDYAVVECGMGGLGDATNVEKSNISVITSVSLDHTDFLGSSIEKIALEKSGIIKNNSVSFLYPNPLTQHIFEKECEKKNATLFKISDKGSFEENNKSVIASVVKYITKDAKVIFSKPPARQEKIGNVLLDGGHNTDSAKALKNLLNDEIAVIAMMKDKDVESYLSIIAPRCKKIIATSVNNSRSMKAQELKLIAQKYCKNVISTENPIDAVKEEGVSLVCGSFYLAREIRNSLLEQYNMNC